VAGVGVSSPGPAGHEGDVLALILTLPATLFGLMAILMITSGLERGLSRSVQAAPVRSGSTGNPVKVTPQS
jgi:hypothetical protein